MQSTNLHTIGHGNKTLDQFIKELKNNSIEFVFDVRSRPMSKFNPQFNRPVLEYELGKEVIIYEFLGEHLGGLPSEPKCYTNNKVDYKKIRKQEFFQEGIRLLIEAHEANMKIALMCSEQNPQDCHRSKLIGQELLKYDININHITLDGIKDQFTVILELTKGAGVKDLFGENDFTSRNEY